MILITFALPHESAGLLPMLEAKTWLRRGPLPMVRGRFGGQEIIVLHTGVGPERATESCKAFLSQHRPELVIAAGYAGGLDPALATGDLVIGENFSHPSLVASVRSVRSVIGQITTQSRIAETPEAKARLAGSTGAIAVEMETAAICEQCVDIPLLSIRAISDPVATPMPVPAKVWLNEQTQQPRVIALLVWLGKHPTKIPGFIRFVRGTILARKRLSAMLTAFLEDSLPIFVHANDSARLDK